MEVFPIILIDFPCWNGNISCIGCTNLESRKSTGGLIVFFWEPWGQNELQKVGETGVGNYIKWIFSLG